MKEKRLVGLRNMDDFKKLRSDVYFLEKMLESILSEYKEFFIERYKDRKSIRKYAAEHNLNRGSGNHIQKKFYTAFAEQLALRDKTENTCRLIKPTENKKIFVSRCRDTMAFLCPTDPIREDSLCQYYDAFESFVYRWGQKQSPPQYYAKTVPNQSSVANRIVRGNFLEKFILDRGYKTPFSVETSEESFSTDTA